MRQNRWPHDDYDDFMKRVKSYRDELTVELASNTAGPEDKRMVLRWCPGDGETLAYCVSYTKDGKEQNDYFDLLDEAVEKYLSL